MEEIFWGSIVSQSETKLRHFVRDIFETINSDLFVQFQTNLRLFLDTVETFCPGGSYNLATLLQRPEFFSSSIPYRFHNVLQMCHIVPFSWKTWEDDTFLDDTCIYLIELWYIMYMNMYMYILRCTWTCTCISNAEIRLQVLNYRLSCYYQNLTCVYRQCRCVQSYSHIRSLKL